MTKKKTPVPEYRGHKAVKLSEFDGDFLAISEEKEVSSKHITMYPANPDGTVNYKAGSFGYIEKNTSEAGEQFIYKYLAGHEIADVIFYLP